MKIKNRFFALCCVILIFSFFSCKKDDNNGQGGYDTLSAPVSYDDIILVEETSVYDEPTLDEAKEYCQREFETLYPEVTRITKPHGYYVDLTDKLRALKNELIALHSAQTNDRPKMKVKVDESRKG